MKLIQILEKEGASKRIGLIALILLMSLILFLRYGEILQAGNQAVLQPNGDAFNAYKIVTFHARYDSTYSHFGGNAYPYGDHVVLSSVLPLVSNTLQFLRKSGFDLTEHAVFILHFSMIFSYWVIAIFLYLTLVKLSLPPWYSVLIAIGITMLSPQSDRIFGHFGLAHAYTIPMVIYFLLLFIEKPRWSISLCLFLTVLLTAAIQFYFFAIAAFLIGVFYFVLLFKKAMPQSNDTKKWTFPIKESKTYAAHFLLQAVLPYLIFTWWIAQFIVLDRPTKPFGYTHYISYWEGVFVSKRMPYYQWVNDTIINIRQIDFEGLAYVGLIAFGVFLVMLYTWFRYFFKRSFFKNLTVDLVHNNFLHSLFITALLLLFFSFGWPFSWPNMEFLLAYTGPLQQFRSVGRFNWIFYYALNIIAFTYLYQVFKSNEGTTLKNKIILFTLLSVFGYEVWQFNHSHPYQMHPLKELQEKDYFKNRLGINFSDYQAILPLPYFNVGTDNFAPQVPIFMQQKSLLLTMESGLPSIASLSNRSSISRTYNLFQTVSEPYQTPNILTDFPNQKPLLIIADTTALGTYQHVIQGLTSIGEIEKMRFFKLPLATYQQRIKNKKAAIQKVIQNDSLFKINGFLSTDSLVNFSYKNFDKTPSAKAYRGAHGLTVENIHTEQVIFKEVIPNGVIGAKYVLSFWCDLTQFPTANTFVFINEKDPKTEAQLWRHFPQIRNYMPVMDNNGWALFEFTFDLQKNGAIEVSILNKEMVNQPFFMDELLIRKVDTDIYQATDLFWNNRWYLKKGMESK